MVERSKKGIISAPRKPINIPQSSQWLAGQGSGSWFHISKKEFELHFTISRFTPNGIIEFEANYNISGNFEFYIDYPFEFTYLSHYKSCNILQNGININFVNIDFIN